MEALFVGNSVILLFWVFITFIVDIKQKYKKVVLMYLITYLANVLNVVPTIPSYALLSVALFIDFEFFEDKFKKNILCNFFDKVIDYVYTVIFQYSYIAYTISLILSSSFVTMKFSKGIRIVFYLISFVMFCLSYVEAANENYTLCSFGEIKKKIDSVKKYRDFLKDEECIVNPYCILGIEDKNYFVRGEKYTFFNLFYLEGKYLKKFFRGIWRLLLKSKEKKQDISKAIRGYSTIEMQLLRTLAIKDGYDCIVRRKIYEVVYSRLFWKNLRLYYKKCGCSVDEYKEYLLLLYMRLAACLNNGGEKQVERVIKKSRKDITKYSKEELFVLVLCFSGKVKRRNVLEIYDELIKDLELDQKEVEQLVKCLK